MLCLSPFPPPSNSPWASRSFLNAFSQVMQNRRSWEIVERFEHNGELEGSRVPLGRRGAVVSKNSKVYSLKTPINGHEVKIIQLIPQPLSRRWGPGGEIMDLDESEILKQRWLFAQSVKWLRNFVTLQKFRKLTKTTFFSSVLLPYKFCEHRQEKNAGKSDKNVDRLLRWINLDVTILAQISPDPWQWVSPWILTLRHHWHWCCMKRVMRTLGRISDVVVLLTLLLLLLSSAVVSSPDILRYLTSCTIIAIVLPPKKS